MTSSSAPKPRPLLFVYGTLRADAGHPMHETVSRGGEHLGPGRVRGRLLRVSWYPGLVLGEGESWVHGEVWRLQDDTLWQRLDAYEGCGPDDARPHEYRRVEVTVWVGGESQRAWTYVYCGPEDGCDPVPGGDWLRR